MTSQGLLAQNDLTIVKNQFTVELKQIASQHFEL